MVHPERRRENLKKIEEMDKHDAEPQQPVWNTECMNKKVDTVEVVRCKDCLYCVKEPNGELYCDILAVGYEPLGSKKVSADWFCADGERRNPK